MSPITKQALLDLLGDRPVAYHPILAKALGGVVEAIFTSQLLYWTGKGKLADRWIYKTQAEMEEETGLTRRNQETARKNLKELGILEEKLKGVPATLHYRLDLNRLSDLVSLHTSDNVQTVQSGLSKPDKLDRADHTNKDVQTAQSIPETTSDYPKITNQGGGASLPPVRADSRVPTDLPDAEAQAAILFPQVAQQSCDGVQQIQRSGWHIRDPDHLQAMACFLDASRLPVPFDKSARKDWIKQIDIHLKQYGLETLRELYVPVIAEMRKGNMTVSRPGSVTNNLASYWAEHKNGGKHGPNQRPDRRRDPDEIFLDPTSGQLVRKDASTGELVSVP